MNVWPAEPGIDPVPPGTGLHGPPLLSAHSKLHVLVAPLGWTSAKKGPIDVCVWASALNLPWPSSGGEHDSAELAATINITNTPAVMQAVSKPIRRSLCK